MRAAIKKNYKEDHGQIENKPDETAFLSCNFSLPLKCEATE